MAEQKCSLCQGKGCLALFFKQPPKDAQPLPSVLMIILYGLPLMLVFIGALLGAFWGENQSLFGAAVGLLCAFVTLRSCQKRLNRLCLRFAGS